VDSSSQGPPEPRGLLSAHSLQKALWVFFSALSGSGGRAGPRCLRLLRIIGVSGVGPAVADRDAGPVPPSRTSPTRRGFRMPRRAHLALSRPRCWMAARSRLLVPAASADGAPLGRPRLPRLPLAGALVFAGRLAENGSRAHVFPRIKCPEKIVDRCARVGVLAAPEGPLTSPNCRYRSAATKVTASQGLTRGQPGCLPDEAPNRRGRR